MANVKGLKVYNHVTYHEYMALDPKTRSKVRALEDIQLSAINPLRGILYRKEQEAQMKAHRDGIDQDIEAVEAKYAPAIQSIKDQIKQLEAELRDLQSLERQEISDLRAKGWQAGYDVEPELRAEIRKLWKKHEDELRQVAGLEPRPAKEGEIN